MVCLLVCVCCLRCFVFVWAWCLMSLCVVCGLLRDAVWCVFVCVVCVCCVCACCVMYGAMVYELSYVVVVACVCCC